MPGNALFEDLYGRVFGARDGEGGLRYDVLAQLMDLENLSPAERIDVLEKAIVVEAVVAAERTRQFEAKTKK